MVAPLLVALLLVGCQDFRLGIRRADETEAAMPRRSLRPKPAATESAAVESAAASESSESAVASESAAAKAESTPVESAVAAHESEAESTPLKPEAEQPPKKAEPAEGDRKPAEGTKKPAEPEEEVTPLPIDDIISETPTVGLKTVVATLLEQASADSKVALGHIEQAKRYLEDEDDSASRQYVQQAIRATSFVRVGLPTVLTRECLDRAVIESQGGRPSRAVETIRAAASIANQVPLKGTVEQFRRRGAQAVKAIEEEQPDRARELLRQMVRMVDTSDAESELDRLYEHLRAVLSAIDRDARKAALAELEGADDALRSILKTFREE